MQRKGKFYGIGVGPGDPELLTQKAINILKRVKYLMIPTTNQSKNGVAESIVSSHIRPDVEKIYLDFPMIVDEESHNKAGIEAAEIIEEVTNKGYDIAFITLGDPMIYSTYGYILKALNNDLMCITVPGITSFCAAAASTNTPLVEKNEILSILPMNGTIEKINSTVTSSDSLVFMKLYHRESQLIQIIKDHNLQHQSVFVNRSSYSDEKVTEAVIEALSENESYLSLLIARKRL